MLIDVLDLSTGTAATYAGIDARSAVIAAYAQSRGDFNTWNYEQRYGDMVFFGPHTVFVGSFSAQHDYTAFVPVN